MKRLILLLAASALATSPAAAQHAGHVMPPPAPAKKAPAKKAPAKKASAKKAPAKKAAAKKPAAKKPAAKKAAPKAPAETKAASDPHAGHSMPAQPAPAVPVPDPHAGHVMPAEQPQAADPHAGHAMPSAPVDVPVGPPPPEALQGPENAADLAWGTRAMEPGRGVLFREHGDIPTSKLLIDQAEARLRSGRDGYFLNAEGWYGGDIDKLWLKTEIEGDFGSKPEQAEFQGLWSHAIDPWFDAQAGVRYDARPDRGTTHLALGVQGLAPYWIEIDAAAFLSAKGDVTARVEAEHDVRITQNLILQPRAEVDFALQDVPRESLGSGLAAAELGLRLRYQVTQQFAPYVGIEYERAFGGTRRFRREHGEDLGGLSLVTGLRVWF